MNRALQSGAHSRQPSPPPGGWWSARVSGPGGGGSPSAYRALLTFAAAPLPHPGLPSAVQPSPFRGGWQKAAILVFTAAVALVSLATPENAHAACGVLRHHPCTPYFGSVFSRHPFMPYSCGVFSRPGCTPELLYP